MAFVWDLQRKCCVADCYGRGVSLTFHPADFWILVAGADGVPERWQPDTWVSWSRQFLWEESAWVQEYSILAIDSAGTRLAQLHASLPRTDQDPFHEPGLHVHDLASGHLLLA